MLLWVLPADPACPHIDNRSVALFVSGIAGNECAEHIDLLVGTKVRLRHKEGHGFVQLELADWVLCRVLCRDGVAADLVGRMVSCLSPWGVLHINCHLGPQSRILAKQ